MIELPEFDTGQYEGCELLMKDGGATLTLKIAEQPDFSISLLKVRWHQFTALPNCTADQVKGAYFKLAELGDSPELKAFMASDRASSKPYKELHHYRIFLDETGCHEFFAESAQACS